MKRGSSAEIVILLATILLSVIGPIGPIIQNVSAVCLNGGSAPCVTGVMRTGGGSTVNLNDIFFSGQLPSNAKAAIDAEGIQIGRFMGGASADDPANFAAGQEYTITIDPAGKTPQFVRCLATTLTLSQPTAGGTITITATSVQASFNNPGGTALPVMLAFGILYSGFAVFPGMIACTNGNDISCFEQSDPSAKGGTKAVCINTCDPTGVTPKMKISIPSGDHPKSTVKVVKSGVSKTLFSGGASLESSTTQSVAGSNNQFNGKAANVIDSSGFTCSTQNIEISDPPEAGGIPEYPLEPVPILALMGALAFFFLIRRRIR